MLAPPWIAVPPPGYGGIEAVLATLCDALVDRGHHVTLFAAPGSQSRARVRTLLETDHPDEIGAARHEADHVGCAWDEIAAAAALRPPVRTSCTTHSGFVALATRARRCHHRSSHTLHGPFDATTSPFYSRHGNKATLVALSQSQRAAAPPGLRIEHVVPNPIRSASWQPRRERGQDLVWIGRFDPVKGATVAIEAARLAGRRLVLAGRIQPPQVAYFEAQVRPHVDGDAVSYVGEADDAGQAPLLRAGGGSC